MKKIIQITCKGNLLYALDSEGNTYFEANDRDEWVLFIQNIEQKSERKKTTGFVKPTIDEIRAFIKQENILYVDPETFLNHYESVGWIVGKNKAVMKDWGSAIRNWNTRNKPAEIKDDWAEICK